MEAGDRCLESRSGCSQHYELGRGWQVVCGTFDRRYLEGDRWNRHRDYGRGSASDVGSTILLLGKTESLADLGRRGDDGLWPSLRHWCVVRRERSGNLDN